jgi:hypothetical protein
MRLALSAAAFALLAPCAFSQSAASAAGHWDGSLAVPGHEIKFLVDLAQDENHAWKGVIAIPEQGLKEFPLSSISVENGRVKFEMKGVPGDPSFDGALAGQSISGNFTQGGATLTFKLDRNGEARFADVAKSTAVAKAFEGTWEGTLNAGGTQLRLVLKLENHPDGPATGTLTSVDQGGAVIPIAAIAQNVAELKLELPSINGGFEGAINKSGTAIRGIWTQGPGNLPLTFQRSAGAK